MQDPVYASRKFYEKLQTVEGWERMSLTRAAQRVQRSAYPDAYAKHETIATQIVNLLAERCRQRGRRFARDGVRRRRVRSPRRAGPLRVKAVVGSGFRTASRPTHQGVDLIVGRYTPIAAVASGVVSVVKCDEDHRGRQTCNVDGYPGKGGCGWMVEIVHAGNVMTRYCHMVQQPVRRGRSAGDRR